MKIPSRKWALKRKKAGKEKVLVLVVIAGR